MGAVRQSDTGANLSLRPNILPTSFYPQPGWSTPSLWSLIYVCMWVKPATEWRHNFQFSKNGRTQSYTVLLYVEQAKSESYTMLLYGYCMLKLRQTHHSVYTVQVSNSAIEILSILHWVKHKSMLGGRSALSCLSKPSRRGCRSLQLHQFWVNLPFMRLK